MSMVHVSFKRSDNDSGEYYDVICPDFNEDCKREIIGVLLLDRDLNNFKFKSAAIHSLENENICPPEFFIACEGDYEVVKAKCNKEEFNCLAWSYFIYKGAMRLLAGKESSIGQLTK